MNAMRTATILAALLALAASATACGGGTLSSAGPSGDEAEVRRLMDRQFDLTKDQDWRQLYETYSPRFQEDCPYSEFLDNFSGALVFSNLDLSTLDVDERNLSVQGDTAYATYIVTYEGRDVEAVTEDDPDVYVQLDGKWYDEVDSHTQCD